jgi:hypothetical protein
MHCAFCEAELDTYVASRSFMFQMVKESFWLINSLLNLEILIDNRSVNLVVSQSVGYPKGNAQYLWSSIINQWTRDLRWVGTCLWFTMFERNIDKASHDGWRRDKQQTPPFIITFFVCYKWDDQSEHIGQPVAREILPHLRSHSYPPSTNLRSSSHPHSSIFRRHSHSHGSHLGRTITGIAPISEPTLTRLAPISEAYVTFIAPISEATLTRLAPISEASCHLRSSLFRSHSHSACSYSETTVAFIAPISEATFTCIAYISEACLTLIFPIWEGTLSRTAPTSEATVTRIAPVSGAGLHRTGPISEAMCTCIATSVTTTVLSYINLLKPSGNFTYGQV